MDYPRRTDLERLWRLTASVCRHGDCFARNGPCYETGGDTLRLYVRCEHRSILTFRRVPGRSFKHHGLHVFELPEMEQYLGVASFEDFRPEVSGSILTFGARKRAA